MSYILLEDGTSHVLREDSSGALLLEDSGSSFTATASGGMVLGGTAAPSVAYAPIPSGGAVLGGILTPSASFAPSPSGGAVLGGTLAPSASFTPVPAGGMVLGGTAPGSMPGGGGMGLGFWPHVGKPSRGTSLHITSTLARGLAAFFPFWEGSGPAYDLIAGTALAPGAGASWGAGSMMGLNCTSTTSYAAATAPTALQIAGPLTIAMGFRVVAAPGVNSAMLGGVTYSSSAGTSPFYGYAFQYASSLSAIGFDVNTAGTLRTVGSATVATGGDYVISASHRSGSQALYLNGAAAGTAAFAGDPTYGSGPIVAVGSNPFVRNPNVLAYWMAIWSRVLDPTEHQALASMPWRLFRPRPIFSPGGSSSFTGAASGGAVVGGLAAPSVAWSPVPSGGAVLGGTLTPSASYAATAAGGAVLGGSAATSAVFTAAASGGMVLGGLATHSIAFTATATGGLVLGGTATGFIPGLIVPCYVDPDAGSLIVAASGPYVDPDAGTAIIVSAGAEIDPDAGTLIIQ